MIYRLIALALLAALVIVPTLAQTSGPGQTIDEQIAALDQRVSSLESRVATLEAGPMTATPTVTSEPPTATPTVEATVAPSETPQPTATPVDTPTPEPTPTEAPTATATATATPSPTPTNTLPPPPTATPAPGVVIVSPGQSISAAIASANAGATVRVLAGVYREYVQITKSIRLEASPEGGSVIIDGQCTRNIGIGILASDVTVYGFLVRDTRAASIRANGDFVGGPKAFRVTVQNNTLHNFDCDNNGNENEAGVSFWYAGSGHRVVGNVINGHPSQLDSAQAPKGGNGVWFKSNTTDPSGGGHLVSGNTIRHVYDGIGGEVEDDARGGLDRNSVIENNYVEDCRDDGISVEGGTRNVVVRSNIIRRCAIGVANAPNLGAGTTDADAFKVIGNDIRQGQAGQYGNVQCFKIGNAANGGLAIYEGNTCILGPGADGWARTNTGVNPIRSRNNYISVGRYVIELPAAADVRSASFDGDTLCTSDATRFVNWGGTRYLTLDAWRAATGQEATGTSC